LKKNTTGESLILERRSWSNKSVFNDFAFFNSISLGLIVQSVEFHGQQTFTSKSFAKKSRIS